jgi:hypothetical protein
MRIASQMALRLALLLVAGCSDSSGPRAPATRVFGLETIDGQSVPAIADSDGTRWDTVLWDTLTLDFTSFGGQEISHTRSQFPADATQEHTDTASLFFSVHGDSIVLGATNCPSICVSRVGRVDASSVTLRIRPDIVAASPEYVYRLVSSSQ